MSIRSCFTSWWRSAPAALLGLLGDFRVQTNALLFFGGRTPACQNGSNFRDLCLDTAVPLWRYLLAHVMLHQPLGQLTQFVLDPIQVVGRSGFDGRNIRRQSRDSLPGLAP